MYFSTCTLHYVLQYMYIALCTSVHVHCIMSFSTCTLHYVLSIRTLHYVLSIRTLHYVLQYMYIALCTSVHVHCIMSLVYVHCVILYRMAFLWKQKTQLEKEQKRNLQEVNQLLLENILPAKVSKYYMEEEQNAVSRI